MNGGNNCSGGGTRVEPSALIQYGEDKLRIVIRLIELLIGHLLGPRGSHI